MCGDCGRLKKLKDNSTQCLMENSTLDVGATSLGFIQKIQSIKRLIRVLFGISGVASVTPIFSSGLILLILGEVLLIGLGLVFSALGVALGILIHLEGKYSAPATRVRKWG